jgi:iron complex transport system ATP-binding protein
MIDLKEIKIGYSNELFHINDITIQNGFLYTLIGKNGSGKSTLFSTLLNQIPTLNGKILINGKELNEFKQNELSKFITFVSSKFDGVQHLNVYDYISLGRMPYTNLLGILKPEDHIIINNVIKKLELTDLIQKDTTKISDGERQLCSIAKALVQETKIILLDEPSAFLDYSNKIKILKTLRNCAKELNICIILSSHDIELSLEHSDWFLVINSKLKKLIAVKNLELQKEKLIVDVFEISN